MKSDKKTVRPVKKGNSKMDKAVRGKPIRSKKPVKTNDLPSSEELVEDLDTLAEKVIFGKNQNRSYALRDAWVPSLIEVISDKSVPQESREEVLFLTLTNALLDMTMDVVPEEMALAYARNLDDYITVTMVNQKYDVDLLKTFREDFKKSEGDNFCNEENLTSALAQFEEEWWNKPRDDLDGKTPNDALEEMAEKYSL